MTNFRKTAAVGAAAIAVAVCSFAFAQDDLDALLSDLETETKAEKKPVADAKAEAPAAVEKPVAEAAEKKSEAPAGQPAAEEQKTEEKAEEAVAEPTVKAETAKAAEPEAKAEEKPAEVVAESETKAEDATEEKAEETVAKSDDKEEKAGSETAAKADAPAAEEKPAVVTTSSSVEPSDAELMQNIVTTERVRRHAFDVQARREIDEARTAMKGVEYEESARHYSIALKLLNDRPATKNLRRECLQGIAESYYRAALQERAIGRYAKAQELMEKALEWRHPKARRELEDWQSVVKDDKPTDLADVAHRRNETEYQAKREKNRKHLRRSRQLLSVRDIDGALDECELVLVNDPYNQEAIRLRGAIQKKRALILESEREVSHDGMIADVDKAWRPVYAPNAREIDAVAFSTIKKPLGDDPERAAEQTIIQRMKEMRLPTVSFKPPDTIIDAIEFFRGASKDFDRPDIPLEQRGFNFVLKTPETLRSQAAQASGEEAENFGESNDDAKAAQAGVPVIPMITASDISFYEALKLVCDSVSYKFKVQGSIVMVMDKSMTVDEMQTRSFPVLSSFMERMGNVTDDMKQMKSEGFGSSTLSSNKKEDEGENKQQDWKEMFSLMGVEWPEGSSIMYIKANGTLRVKNTEENLAEFAKALTDMNFNTRLIEVEARFVEVEQQDLNSLGFEWILNSDYSIGMDNWLGKALNMKSGMFDGSVTKSQTQTGVKTVTTTSGNITTKVESPVYADTYTETSTVGANWVKGMDGYSKLRTMGINAFGGDTDYQNGMRYLSTEGNHISGEGKSTNDQFMRVNAFIGNADLSMILHMLSQRSDTDLLNAPKVLTKPGEEAVIKVVTEYIYPTDFDVQLQSSNSSSSSSSGGSQSAVLAVVEPSEFTMREVGVILDVTPQTTENGNIIDLKLDTKVVDEPTWKNYGMKIPFTGNSSLQSFEGIGGIFDGLTGILNSLGGGLDDSTKELFAASAVASATSALDSLSSSANGNIKYYEAPMEQPWFHVRSIESNVQLYPGSTIVMGGLIREERSAMDDKIPFLGDLPFVGRFFRSHAEKTTKRNLLIFLTARYIDASGREETQNFNESSKADVKAAPDQKAE